MAPSKLPKCDQCSKSITKRAPGVECNKCGMVVHANSECANLTNKQLAAIKASGKLEWMCDDCHSRSPRRSSLIIPEDDEHEDDEVDEQPHTKSKTLNIDVRRMTQNITRDIEKAIKKQLSEIENAIEYCSNKVDEYGEEMTAFRTKVKMLEKKNESLENTKNHLELKIMAIEQKLNEDQQKSLAQHLEIAGVPYEDKEDISILTKKIATKLDQNTDEIKTIKRAKGRNDGIIMVELKDNSNPSAWVKASKTAKIKLSDLVPRSTNDSTSKNFVIVRHALTTYNKTLLYEAKQQLAGKYKYIWTNAEGKILVRKDDASKIKAIRFREDIRNLLS